MKDLFDDAFARTMPLAERMRPDDFSGFVGHEKVVGKGMPLREAVESDQLQSLILWGPPGSGKTTLAHIIAEKSKAFFHPFSAAVSGIPELRNIIREAEDRLKHHGTRTILFVDEIHRFNRTQQDAFLPHVERGTVVLIGATTENPSFALVRPLLSRSLVLVLDPLSLEDVEKIIRNALADKERGLGQKKVSLSKEGMQKLVHFSDGDARIALNALEFTVKHAMSRGKKNAVMLSGALVEEALQKKTLRYDKKGEEHYNLISAFIKSMRDSDPHAALYWMTRMLEGGEDPRFIARRMVIFASEDIGNAQPTAIAVAVAVADAVAFIGMPEAAINLAQGVTYLALAKKDNASYTGLMEAWRDTKEKGALPVPKHLRNATTNLMKELGHGKGYAYAHDFKDAKVDQEHLPKELKGKKYYRPKK
ncbi:MAG: AAA family ATPase [Candidatus Niyogibacteria bacterium CG10_big_fil_rev_8_21_14_0_10_46_36]|uniref:Replication-associated recombination protein A n=1 Tax=Candidatus Niyogibacteria bacterium CG10_big_fil_rev_8_21_14_0_10_46_36 TaxID=1974726 RepID=A0A2H0TE16_9BACT|nr:MAG: AAA family ATPase [Candidatus Niyogibacteria bacterium CG10_big_fil_rev_8_21_14_0_10_46_36]